MVHQMHVVTDILDNGFKLQCVIHIQQNTFIKLVMHYALVVAVSQKKPEQRILRKPDA